jgi:hypothetical protein
LSSEDETKKLLIFREEMEKRISLLKSEIEDLRRAIAEIDRRIVSYGFRQPIVEPLRESAPAEDNGAEESSMSIKSKDGVSLGTLLVKKNEIIFSPRSEIIFNVSTPPFQSFLVDRVLSNMRLTDEEKVKTGEISANEVMTFEVLLEGERISNLVIRNYGGDRRLREIQSSLRWTFDKMHEKTGTGG